MSLEDVGAKRYLSPSWSEMFSIPRGLLPCVAYQFCLPVSQEVPVAAVTSSMKVVVLKEGGNTKIR